MNSLQRVFKKKNSIVIGVVHFPPLLGFADFPGYKSALRMALTDLRAFEAGGVDAIFFENNYGLSGEVIASSQAVAMSYLIGELKKHTKLPLGVSVLWNDYETAFALARTHELQFIRVPVFVDTVEPYCGVIKGDPKRIMACRQRLGAENVLVLTDILVKHAKHISKHSLHVAARKAERSGADAVIVTGNWTGESPTPETLETLRERIGTFPIFVGSGADKDNVPEMLEHANGVIVSTALKAGKNKKGERNVKGFKQRVLKSKVAAFVKSAKARK